VRIVVFLGEACSLFLSCCVGCYETTGCIRIRLLYSICSEGLREFTETISQDSRSPGRDLNLGPPKYKAGMRTTRPRRPVNTV
jgi:hypothetical protein